MSRTRTALVTGANRGIGLAIAQALGRMGLEVIAGCRDPAEGAAALPGIEVRALDLGDPASIQAACRPWPAGWTSW